MKRSAKINGDILEYSCGCKFPIIEREPELKIKFDPHIESLNLECPLTWSLFADGNTKGVFQLETRFGQQYSKQLKPENIEHLAGLMSILRPGCIESVRDGKNVAEHYILRKNGEEEVDYVHPSLKDILDETYGEMIYQEQSMRIAQEIAGFNLEEADILRKCIAKGSLVYTNNGPKPIESVNNNDLILTVVDDTPAYLPIKDAWFSGIQDVYEVLVDTGQKIEVTRTHEIFTLEDGWKQTQNLTSNDYIITYSLKSKSTKWSKVISITHVCKKRTYDFEVDSDKHHYGFINGILVHNSIGKKKADLMAKVKGMFLEGCKKKGIVSEDIAEQIFGWIEKSQRYSFNKSHAVSYALNAYLSAYAKAHFPISFFTSYLYFSTSKQKKFDEIKLLVSNARTMDIKVCPPSFAKMNRGFKRIDKKIYFGMTNIKGLGESVFEKLKLVLLQAETALNKTRDQWNWAEFLVYFSKDAKSSSGIEALIESGALDYLGVPRQIMLFEYGEYNKLTQKECAWVKQHVPLNSKTRLIDIIQYMLAWYDKKEEDRGDVSKPCANKNRVAKLKDMVKTIQNPPYNLRDSSDWISRIEEARLGISLTATALDDCKELSHANCTCKQFANHNEPNSGIFIACQIEEIKEIMSANGEMAFITISDNDSFQIDAVCFHDTWMNLRNTGLCVKENTVLIAGERSNRGSLIIKNMWQLK